MRPKFLLVFLLLVTLPGPAASQSAERLYQQACDGGDVFVCNVFGLMLESGDGVTRDPERAAGFYQRACQGGELVGCTNLGLLYEAGTGITQSTPRAVGLFQVACEGGQSLGCERLGDAIQAGSFEPVEFFTRLGRIWDAVTGEALEGAIVEVVDLGMRAITDRAGRVELSRLPTGTHFLRVSSVGYEVMTGDLEVPGKPDFFVLMDRGAIGDVDAPGQIVGRVEEESGQGLSDVEISVLGQPRARTLSNRQGRFTLRDVEPGAAEIRFARLGYAPRTATLIVQPARTAEVAAKMFVQPIELEAIQVTVVSSYLDQNGFFRRADDGRGSHFSPQDIERISPVLTSDLVRHGVPGVRIEYGRGGEARLITRRTVDTPLDLDLQEVCVLQVYLDGIPQVDSDIDLVQPSELQAMEIFQPLTTPIEFTSAFNACGVVLIWTRRGA